MAKKLLTEPRMNKNCKFRDKICFILEFIYYGHDIYNAFLLSARLTHAHKN
jgi:hypothetical protein